MLNDCTKNVIFTTKKWINYKKKMLFYCNLSCLFLLTVKHSPRFIGLGYLDCWPFSFSIDTPRRRRPYTQRYEHRTVTSLFSLYEIRFKPDLPREKLSALYKFMISFVACAGLQLWLLVFDLNTGLHKYCNWIFNQIHRSRRLIYQGRLKSHKFSWGRSGNCRNSLIT